jgi:hypothetical protein
MSIIGPTITEFMRAVEMDSLADCASSINYSLISAGCDSVIRRITIPLACRAEAHVSGFTQEPVILEGGTTTGASPVLDSGIIAQLSNPVKTRLIIRANDGTDEERWLTVLPLCAWDQGRDHARATAAFVLENDPFVLRIRRKLDVSSPRDIYALTKQIYNTLGESFEVCYLFQRGLLADFNFAQLVRFPSQMHYDGGGTCIDLVLLFAAILRAADLEPLVLILGEEHADRHALIAVWNMKHDNQDIILDPDRLYKAITNHQLLVVEATALTQDQNFEAAVEEGSRRALLGDLLWGIDVTAARHGREPVHPLPEQPCATILSGLPAPITDAFTATKTSEAASRLSSFALEVTASGDRRDLGSKHKLRGWVIRIGKGPHNQIMLHDSTVSREHGVLFVREAKFFLKDLGSKNGTFVEGHQVEPYLPKEIYQGASFRVGQVKVRLV